ncbi:helix-turn-helix transcriptional regulator [Clostridium neonatale]|nr:helix-turn-helix transcriptional regulator [Clostridium neonatale]
MHERVKLIRKDLNLTQKEFGAKMAVGQSYLANIESGLRPVTDKIIKLICTVFNVNENWLVNGIEPKFNEPDSFVLEEYAKSKGANDFEISIIEKFVKNFFNQPEDVRNAIISTFTNGISNQNDISATKEENTTDIDKEVEAYRKELEAQEKGRISSVSEKPKYA